MEKTIVNEPLRMNLPFFAQKPSEPADENEPTESTDTNTTETNPESTPAEKNESEERKFTQADIDRAVQERLAREKKKREQAAEQARLDAERKHLAEQEKYKELAENLQSELDAYKTQALDAKRDALLAKAGYSEKQIEKYRKFIVGETDEDLAKAVDELVEDIPPKPKYVDPSAGNAPKPEPQPKDGTELGHDLFAKIKKAGKFRK